MYINNNIMYNIILLFFIYFESNIIMYFTFYTFIILFTKFEIIIIL
jgi:hypothetical protein